MFLLLFPSPPSLLLNDAPFDGATVPLSPYVINYVRLSVVSQGITKLSMRVFVRRKKDAEVHTGWFNTCVLSSAGKVTCFGM
jgi:hypothetical protein